MGGAPKDRPRHVAPNDYADQRGVPGKATTGEVAKDPAREVVVNDQPSSSSAPAPSRYLKFGDDLFVSIPREAGTRTPLEGEVFDEEILTAAGI